jgi:hypothetical protein
LRVADSQLTTVGERDEGTFVDASGTQLEQPGETPKAPGRLSTAYLAVAVDYGEQAIANNASLVDLNFFETLSEQRLDRVSPKLKQARGHRPRVYVSESCSIGM